MSGRAYVWRGAKGGVRGFWTRHVVTADEQARAFRERDHVRRAKCGVLLGRQEIGEPAVRVQRCRRCYQEVPS